jgi:hypothetical protein
MSAVAVAWSGGLLPLSEPREGRRADSDRLGRLGAAQCWGLGTAYRISARERARLHTRQLTE